ncbi:MAG: hypothetical protein J6Y53_03640 [Alphaproteobacteria bacterium]|nr:hypothetical protein [Alphaproteobacteria bacterium]
MNGADFKRIEDIKKKHPRKRVLQKNLSAQVESKKEQPKKGRWLKYIPFAMLGFSLFAKKADAQTPQKAPTQTVVKKAGQPVKADTTYFYNTSSMYNEIMNMAVEEVLENPDFVKDVANDAKFIAEISKNPEIIADICEKAGMNTIGNFDISGFDWTPGYLQALKGGKNANTLIKNINLVRNGNPDGRSCLGAVNNALNKIDAACYVSTVHQAIPMLLSNPNLVNLENVPYDCYIFLPNGTVGAQDENPVYPKVVTGHIWLKQNVNGVAEQVYGPEHRPVPEDSMRNRRNDTWYGDAYVFAPADNIVTRGNNNNAPTKDAPKAEDLLLVLMSQKRYKGDIKEMLIMLGEKDPQTLAVLYIEHSNLKNMYGLDQIAKPSKTTKTAKVTKEQSNKQHIDENTKEDKGDSVKQHLTRADKPLKAPSDKSKLLKARDIAALISDRNNRV